MLQTYTQEVEETAHAIARNHVKIKAFVRRYHERAATLLSLAARFYEGSATAHRELIEEAVSAREVDDALELAHALGPAAAPVVPEIITAYYGGWTIDALV